MKVAELEQTMKEELFKEKQTAVMKNMTALLRELKKSEEEYNRRKGDYDKFLAMDVEEAYDKMTLRGWIGRGINEKD